jgi:hypothetical protein
MRIRLEIQHCAYSKNHKSKPRHFLVKFIAIHRLFSAAISHPLLTVFLFQKDSTRLDSKRKHAMLTTGIASRAKACPEESKERRGFVLRNRFWRRLDDERITNLFSGCDAQSDTTSYNVRRVVVGVGRGVGICLYRARAGACE